MMLWQHVAKTKMRLLAKVGVRGFREYLLKKSDVQKLEGWGGINHTKEQVEDEGQGVGGKQLQTPE